MSRMEGRAQVGTTVAGCRLLESVGRGSMGEIFRAHHERLDRPVAVKVFPVDGSDPAAADRLLLEARALAKLEHPNVVRVYDVGLQEGLFYIVMQFLEGRTLKALFEESGKVPLERLYPVAAGVGEGLAAIHEKGIIHRDLKMENVMVGEDGVARITDFGLVYSPGEKDQYRGKIVGTPAYIAPEQWIGRPVDARSDLYALGVLLYGLSTGQYPFTARGAPEWRERHLKEVPKSPSDLDSDLGEDWSAIVLKLLTKVRDQRYGSVRDFLADLERCRQGKAPAAATKTRRGVRCSFCETVNPSGQAKCSVCRESLQVPAGGSLDLQVRTDEMPCPSCGNVCARSARACPRCGKGICTRCRKRPSPSGGLCPGCAAH